MEAINDIRTFTDYSYLLQVYGVSFVPEDSYFVVGTVSRIQGWILHISSIEPELDDLINTVVPKLIALSVPFKVVRDKNTAIHILEGTLGYNNMGKIITIYPEEDHQANELAKQLIVWTKGFRGPVIPTDRQLKGIVHTRYGSFNSIIIKDSSGCPVKHIYNSKGELIPDPYGIPFQLPKDILWPFKDITTALPSKKDKLLNYKYYPLTLLKPDSKGIVMKGLYFGKYGLIRSCLLKQGKKDMLVDNAGRDIDSRLQWQHQLYQELGSDIPMPIVFDYFKDKEENSWLSMEFIKGVPLSVWIPGIYKNLCWRHLSSISRLKLLDVLLSILTIIERMHEKGYIHRDITAENFLITKNNSLYLIDMELTWSLRNEFPSPPFQLGTPGYASPEQMARNTPTPKEDIYGIGGLMALFFTNQYPFMFNSYNAKSYREALYFFTGEPALADCIAACQNKDSNERPTLQAIQGVLRRYHEGLKTCKNDNLPLRTAIFPVQLEETIKVGLAGLADPKLLSGNQEWMSLPLTKETRIGNNQLEKKIYEGWHTGLSGPLWMIGLAKKAGFSIRDCWSAYANSWEYILQNSFNNFNDASNGLYSGTAGMALALAIGMDTKLVLSSSTNIQYLQDCFSRSTEGLCLADGQAGQGIALQQCAHLLDEQFVSMTLDQYVKKILACQLSNGAWNVSNSIMDKKQICTGLDHGVAGIVWFLLCYLEKKTSDEVQSAIEKALNWLIKVSIRRRNKAIAWPVSTGTRLIDIWNSGQGAPGIVLIFIKAYKLLKEQLYKNIVEQALQNIPSNPIRLELSLSSGLAGLGEVYLDAFQAFQDSEWREKADWITQVLMHRLKKEETGSGSWSVDTSVTATADLFTGNSGVLHFLLRQFAPELIGHPLNNISYAVEYPSPV